METDMRIRKTSLPSVLLLLLCCVAVVRAQEKLLTIDDIFDPAKRVNFNGTPPTNLQWLKDGDYYLQGRAIPQTRLFNLWKVNARTGEAVPFFDAAKMESALTKLQGMKAEDANKLAHQSFYQLNPAQTAVLLNHQNDLIYYELGSDKAVKLTNNSEEETDEDFSPDGRYISFVRNNNLFVLDISSGRERALTSDGGEKVFNGRLDWVYEEELYGRGNKRGYWWSPDSKRIAYLRLDEADVASFPVVDHIPRAQVLEETAYPLAGEPNPRARLGIVDAAGGKTVWADTSKYEPKDFLIVRVAWSPDGRVVYQAQDRAQTLLELNSVGANDGKPTMLFREQTKTWVEAVDNPRWLKDGSFLWKSERDGFMHLYHYSADGKLIKKVTDGRWEVRELDAVDEANGVIYFRATEHSPIAEQVYRIRLDGSQMTRLSQAEGNHRPNFNPQGTLFIDYWSDVNTPTQVRLFGADGQMVRAIDENKVDALKQYKLGKTEFLQVKTRDGFVMEAMMIRPPDFDPSKKYPVMSFTYSGPHAPQVKNSWGAQTYMWHQMLAQKGYIIWVCDNRSASGKGAESAWPVYRNLGALELQDLEDGLSYLKSQPFVDGSRIGLWGWSYGGYMTAYALTHSKSFKMGIAGGTVTDWGNYDSIYTERYMQTPQRNPEGYKTSSVLQAAGNLSGKLLLIHGAIDDNVHMANTIQLVYALQKAGKQFDLMLYPKSRHGVTDPLLLKHLRQMMTDYILENL
jgi:dipeptidyl-peptidase-4